MSHPSSSRTMSPSSAEAASSLVNTAADGPCHDPQHGLISVTKSKPSHSITKENDSDIISKTVPIDQYGDLRLIVGEEKVCFLVCSRALARSAPFWNTLLYGPFAEARPDDGNEWKVKLPEDHPGALEVILVLIHWPGHSKKITAVDLNLAFEVAVLTNKYSMTHCLASYARQWLEDLAPVPDHEFRHWAPPIQWLFLAQELGGLSQYLTAYKHLVIRCGYRADKPSTAKSLMCRDPTSPHTWQPISGVNSVISTAGRAVIDNLVEEINVARFKMIDQIQSFVRDGVTKLRKAAVLHDENDCSYSGSQAAATTICQAEPFFTSWKEKYDCDFSMLGVVTVWQEKSSWPLTCKPEDEPKSVHSCHSVTMRAIKRLNNHACRLRGQEHKHCTPFKTEVISMEKLEQTVEGLAMAKSHYIGRQALLSGLDRAKIEGGSRKRTHQQMEKGSAQ